MTESAQPTFRKWVFRTAVVVMLGAVGAAAFHRSRPKADPPAPETIAGVLPDPLPEADREFLWNAENRGLELGQFGWPVLRDALQASDREAVRTMLSPDFVGLIPENPKRLEVDAKYARVVRLDDAGRTPRSLNASDFCDWLVGYRDQLVPAPIRFGFSLKAITPVDRDQPQAAWRGAVQLSMRGEHRTGQPAEVAILFDFEVNHLDRERLAQGGWLKSCQVRQIDVSRSDHFLFREVAAERGLAPELHDNWKAGTQQINTGGAYLCDYNRDGYLDVLITETTASRTLFLYAGGPDGFDDVTDRVGLGTVQIAIKATFADLDRDGWEDLILPGLAVYRNIEGTRFEDVTNVGNLVPLISGNGPLENITGITVVDYDRDGRVDLYVTRADAFDVKDGSWIDGQSGSEWVNQLLRNLGDGRFEDVTEQTGTSGDKRSVFTAAWLDANNDGRPDVYLIHEFGAGILLINEADGTFSSRELTDGVGDFASMGLATGDVNNDGLTDVYVANMYSKAGNRVMDNLPPGFYDESVSHRLRRMVAGSQLYLNRDEPPFDVVGNDLHVDKVGWGWGPRIADLDNDGWQDIYASCGFISKDRNKPDG